MLKFVQSANIDVDDQVQIWAKPTQIPVKRANNSEGWASFCPSFYYFNSFSFLCKHGRIKNYFNKVFCIEMMELVQDTLCHSSSKYGLSFHSKMSHTWNSIHAPITFVWRGNSMTAYSVGICRGDFYPLFYKKKHSFSLDGSSQNYKIMSLHWLKLELPLVS